LVKPFPARRRVSRSAVGLTDLGNKTGPLRHSFLDKVWADLMAIQ
jgi:hypothetical protein